MSDEPESLVLRMLRRIDAKLDRVVDDMADLKVRVGGLETSVADLYRRIDRRLDVVRSS